MNRVKGFKIIRCLSGNFHVEAFDIYDVLNYITGKAEIKIVPIIAVITEKCSQFSAIKIIYERRMAA